MLIQGIIISQLFVLVHGIHWIGVRCGGPFCLHLYDDHVTWQESYDRCRSEGLELVRIENGQIQATIERLLGELPRLGQYVWTAGRGSGDGTWRYTNGSRFLHTVTGLDWNGFCLYAYIYPDSTCRPIQYHSGKCDENSDASVLCQYYPTRGNCPDCRNARIRHALTGYGPSEKTDWFGAQTSCSETYGGGGVAYSIPPQLYQSIFNMLEEGTDRVRLWLGVTQLLWQWRTGPDANDRQPMGYFYWHGTYGGPMPYSKCVYVYHAYDDRWRVASCTTKHRYFICMEDKRITTSTATTTTTTTNTGHGITPGCNTVSSAPLNDDDDDDDDNTLLGSTTGLIVMGVIIAILVAVVVAVVVLLKRKKKFMLKPTSHDSTYEQVGTDYDNVDMPVDSDQHQSSETRNIEDADYEKLSAYMKLVDKTNIYDHLGN